MLVVTVLVSSGHSPSLTASTQTGPYHILVEIVVYFILDTGNVNLKQPVDLGICA